MYADMIRHHAAGNALIDSDAYRRLMDEWKQDTATLIEEILEGKAPDATV